MATPESFTRIGLLSDSHGDGRVTDRAVKLLLSHGAQVLLHLGDIETEPVIDALAVTDRAAVRLVFGNCDWDAAALGRYAAGLGIHADDPIGAIDTPRGRLAFCHGHVPRDVQRALNEGVAYLCHGHTHMVADRREGATRVINPGALHRAATYTVALLDAERDALDVLRVERR